MRLTRSQHEALEHLVDNGKQAMHLVTRTLVGRQSSTDSGSSSSSTCQPGNNSAICQKPVTNSTETMPIVLGAVIPICCALIVFVFLHRRYLKRQRLEDQNDPHKSLDFGTDMSAPSKLHKNRPGVPEMKVTDMSNGPTRPGRGRGMSFDMDMEMSNPYLLPAVLHGSRESLHSMSRQDEHDPYRPVTMLRTSTDSRRPRQDNASMYSASTNVSANEKANLLVNARPISQSYPAKRQDSMSPNNSQHNSQSSDELLTRQMHSNNRSIPPSRKTSLGSSDNLLTNVAEISPPPPRKQSLPKPPPPPEPPVEHRAPPPRSSSASAPRPPRKSSASAGTASRNLSAAYESGNYGEAPPAVPQMPMVNEPQDYDYATEPAAMYAGRFSIDTPNPSQQYPVQPQPSSTMGLRPLPPDLPEDNPEIRANRIRSFYKEYFDDSNRGRPAPGQYQEDYDANYMDGAIYDSETGGFVIAGRPFAEPTGRRAMTPPPRGAPRMDAPHRRQYSTQSAGRTQVRGRSAGPAPPMPKVRAPPPKALVGLPTPHKLKDYDSVISSPIDFAPPTSFRQMQNGSRPSSPLGGARPYSPTVKAFTPLASAYDDLGSMPSPYLLRKSGTFTALDFAPPSRFKNSDTGSDAGSIRSARSGISAMQLDAVRAGAYRVSRIPKEMVTTRDDLATQLKPRWDLTTPA